MPLPLLTLTSPSMASGCRVACLMDQPPVSRMRVGRGPVRATGGVGVGVAVLARLRGLGLLVVAFGTDLRGAAFFGGMLWCYVWFGLTQ